MKVDTDRSVNFACYYSCFVCYMLNLALKVYHDLACYGPPGPPPTTIILEIEGPSPPGPLHQSNPSCNYV